MVSERPPRRYRYELSSAIYGAIEDISDGETNITVRGDAAASGDPECTRQAMHAIFSAVVDRSARVSVTSDASRVYVAVSGDASFGAMGRERIAIARWLVELSGGALEISEKDSRTCALVSLPRCDTAWSVQPARGPLATGPVLILDDDGAARDVAALVLARVGVATISADSIEDGLDCAKNAGISAIVLEVATEALEGWNALRILQSDPKTRDIPIVVLTIHDDPENAMALGAAAFLRKPFSQVELVSALRRAGACPGTLVLAVDDDPAALEIYERTLGARGLRVLRASAARAISALETAKPDLIVATHAARALEEKARALKIPIVGIAHAPLTDAERAFASTHIDALVEQRDVARPSFRVKLETAVRASMPTLVPRRRSRHDRPSISP